MVRNLRSFQEATAFCGLNKNRWTNEIIIFLNYCSKIENSLFDGDSQRVLGHINSAFKTFQLHYNCQKF